MNRLRLPLLLLLLCDRHGFLLGQRGFGDPAAGLGGDGQLDPVHAVLYNS